MRYLIDENIPAPLVPLLRNAGHDVQEVAAVALGAEDRPVLEQATRGRRVLVSLDLDFGELVFRDRMSGESGVVLLRLPTHSLQLFLQLAFDGLQSRDDWAGHFSVIEPGRIRMTPLAVPKP